MYRPNENENCGSCKYSCAPYLNAPITSKRNHLYGDILYHRGKLAELRKIEKIIEKLENS
jgi:hypothetical protein